MRAFASDAFGQPGAIRQLPTPDPAEGELLIRVKAASLNATDLAVMAGWLKDYMEHVFPLIPGIDASGVIERLGQGVTGYAVGDEVVGYTRRPVMGRGTLAELTALPANGVLHKPKTLEHHEAAVIPHSALTAMAAIKAADLQPGQRVVCLGATGGVGSYATQLAAGAGAPVLAVTRGTYTDYALSLGAADAVDYESGPLSDGIRQRYPDGIDVLLDVAGVPELLPGLVDQVRDGGKVISTLTPPDEAWSARGIQGFLVSRYAAEEHFDEIVAKVVDETLRLPAIQTFPFDDVDAALGLQATRHVEGKLAVLISQ